MPRGDVETYQQDRKWHNRIEGDQQPFSDHFTKGDARLTGREEAARRKVDHIMRNATGQVFERNSYRDGSVVREEQPVPPPPSARVVSATGSGPQAQARGSGRQVRIRPAETRPRPTRRDPRVSRVLHEINEELRGQPAGVVLWALISRVPAAAPEVPTSMPQLAAYAAAIHAGTFKG